MALGVRDGNDVGVGDGDFYVHDNYDDDGSISKSSKRPINPKH